jgi:hypothetical protein
MFIELVDALRCVRRPAHELTWLVASAFRMEDRDILDGVLGCPICKARYPIADGVANFRDHQEAPEGELPRDVPVSVPGSELALRVAAFLDLVEPGGLAVLAGAWSSAASDLGALVERIHVLALDPVGGLESGSGVSIALTADEVPLRPGVARGIALDASHAAPGYVASAVEALRPRGRLLAPVELPLPSGVTELARDERHWLAVKNAASSPVVPLQVSRIRP